MIRRSLGLLTAFTLALAPIGCSGDKSSSGVQPSVKGGADPKAPGPVAPGGGGKGGPGAKQIVD